MMLAAGATVLIGLDDTDTRDSPGTNKLALHLAGLMADVVLSRTITRHQLLQHPDVPCTNKNGCAAWRGSLRMTMSLDELAERIVPVMLGWCPAGSDPGLCLLVEERVSQAVIDFGRRCQQSLVTQAEARHLAQQERAVLLGLGGTEGGVIGALAAVGLAATHDDGRVLARGPEAEVFEITGVHSVADILARGVDEVCRFDGAGPLEDGLIHLGKRLRPVMRGGRVVLFVRGSLASDETDAPWIAERVL